MKKNDVFTFTAPNGETEQQNIDPVVKYQTRIEAEEWCAAHNIPVSTLKEEKSGFVFTKTFSYV